MSLQSHSRRAATTSADPNLFPAKGRRVGSLSSLAAAPDEMLLAPAEVSALTGFAEETLRLWRKQRRGPAWRMVEGMPRLTMGAYREWLAKAA